MISAHNISYTNDQRKILSSINISIQKNKITVISGKNGSGKSTLLKILNRLIVPSKGSIKSQYEKPVPMLFQRSLSLNKSLEENFLLLNSIKKTKIDRTFYNLFNLKKLKANKFPSLSEGEKQKVFISRLMSFEQDILIMDEPNQNLDIESEEKFFDKLSNLSKSKTIIMTLHDMNNIKKLADNLIILDNGKVIFDDLVTNY